MATYVIGDIHGEYVQLKNLVQKMQLKEEDELYVLGDVIDAVKHARTVFSQAWEPSQDNSFLAPIEERSSRMYLKLGKCDPQQLFRKLYDFYAAQKIAVDAQISMARLKDGENFAFLTPTELTMHQCDVLVAQLSAGGINVISRLPVLN